MAGPDSYKVSIHSARPAWHRRAVSIFLWLCTLAYLGLYISSLFMAKWQLAFLRANPLLGAPRDVLITLGLTATYKIQGPEHEWWRVLSSLFNCAGTLHVWAISSGLWTFGLFLATALYPWQLVLLFFMSGLAGSTASANIAGDFVTSAASGPIFGFIGGTCACLLLHRKQFVNHTASWGFAALVLGLNLYMGATPFVDNSCNCIAFGAGLMTTFGLLLLNKTTSGSLKREWGLRAGCCVLLIAALSITVISVLGLLIPDKSPVQGCCNNWVCTPSSLWDCSASRVTLPCTYTTLTNGTSIMYCPRGAGSMVVPAGMADADLLSLCDTACGGVVSAAPAPAPTGGGGGTGGSSNTNKNNVDM